MGYNCIVMIIFFDIILKHYPVQLLHVVGGAGAEVLGPNPPKRL